MAPLWDLCWAGKLDEVRSALAGGEDVNDKGYTFNGYTALMIAVKMSHNSIVKLLLDQPGVKINEQIIDGSLYTRNYRGWTALHWAAWHNNREAARMLLLHPTMDSANAKTNGDNTAVMIAVREGYKEVLSELVAHESVSLDIGNVVGSAR